MNADDLGIQSPVSNFPAAGPGAGAVQRFIVGGLLLVALGLVFGQTVGHEFVNLDDNVYVYQNPHVAQGLSAHGVAWAFTHSHVANWHPLTWLSLMLDCQLYGLQPGGHHLTNLLLHAATALTLFLVLQSMTGSLWPSALASFVFAVHPLRVESVAWITERKDVLSGLFFMLTLGAYVAYVRRPFSFFRYGLVVVLLAMGLMSKAMLVTTPIVLLLLDVWPLRRIGAASFEVGAACGGPAMEVPGVACPSTSQANVAKSFSGWSRCLLEKVPLLALAAAVGFVTLVIQDESLAMNERLSFGARVGHAVVSYVFYLGKFFWPGNLAAVYPEFSVFWSSWEPWAALFALAAVTFFVILFRRRRPYLFVGWLWYLVMTAPVAGFLQVGLVNAADRFTYLPQVGLTMALVWGAADLSRHFLPRRVTAVAGVFLCLVLMGLSWRQTSVWRDSESLWRHVLACTANNSAAHNAFGNALVDLGKRDEAIAQYRKAIAIRPGYAAAHFNLGAALAAAGAAEEALAEYRTAISLKPRDARAHNNLGQLLFLCGRLDEALRHCREAVELDPELAEARYNFGNVLLVLGHSRAAMAEYRHAVRIAPDFAPARYNLGFQLAERGRFEEAIVEYRKALDAAPDFAEAHNGLGLALAAQGRRAAAAEHFCKALAIRPGFIEARRNLERLQRDAENAGNPD